ncbi:MAG: transposase [bacterium]
MSPIGLSELEVRELSKLMQTTPSAYLYRKAQVIWLSHLGKSIPEIAAITNMNGRTVYRWLAFYRQKKLDALLIGSRRGRPPKITEEYRKLLLESVQKSPEAFGYSANRWTLKLLAEHMTLNTGIQASFQRIWQILISHNILFRMPKVYIVNPKYYSLLKHS